MLLRGHYAELIHSPLGVTRPGRKKSPAFANQRPGQTYTSGPVGRLIREGHIRLVAGRSSGFRISRRNRWMAIPHASASRRAFPHRQHIDTVAKSDGRNRLQRRVRGRLSRPSLGYPNNGKRTCNAAKSTTAGRSVKNVFRRGVSFLVRPAGVGEKASRQRLLRAVGERDNLRLSARYRGQGICWQRR